ncbi:MAG: toll/interleukin-1 receptor domain-containing protein [Acidobacteria bacterium]|nr:toll/interleukin-1 receptor domain-containing protein [Acidobacteriota bacterium]
MARLVRQCLKEGSKVEIDGLGAFLPGKAGAYEFVAESRPRVFLAYVEEDLAAVRRLFAALARRGFDPWMDKEKLLPGQNWPRAIERAIERSDFFIACFSGRSTGKRGFFHFELRYALDCAARLPLDEVYFIPVRLDKCTVPAAIQKSIQYVDLFPDWEQGVNRVAAALKACELTFCGSRPRSWPRGSTPGTSGKPRARPPGPSASPALRRA